jgi:hypothetical protein
MAGATFDQVQQLVDQLSPLEQVKLLEYLTPRIVEAMTQKQSTTVSDAQYSSAWAELFRIGDAITGHGDSDSATLTS